MLSVQKNNVRIIGAGTTTIVFAHGYGCDQHMWHRLTPAFTEQYRVVLFDHVGAGGSDLRQYDRNRYATLQAYADDFLAMCDELGLKDVVFVGHSVSAMIGILASIAAPGIIAKLVLIGPSPCYINDGDYVGGFAREDIDELLDMLGRNYLGWSSTFSPVIMGNPDRPELARELEASFCRTDPAIAKAFARVTFLSDHRADLGKVTCPTLVLQCSEDFIAPECVGQYVHAHIPGSRYVLLKASGHCPHLSAPEETAEVIREFL